MSTKNTKKKEKIVLEQMQFAPKMIFKPHCRNISQGLELKPYLAALPQQAKILLGLA